MYQRGEVSRLKQTLKNINWLNVAKVALAAVIILAPAAVTYAQLPTNIGTTAGLRRDETSFSQLVTFVINIMLGIAFVVAVLFLIIGGFQYITSAGNEEAAEKGKGTVVNALIGIVIIILSYVMVNVVSNLVGKSGTSGIQ